MSLIQYHGEIPLAATKFLSPEGLLKSTKYPLAPVLHLPMRPYSENDAMYDKWALQRFRAKGHYLLPLDMCGGLSGAGIHKKHVHGLILNYDGSDFMIDSHVGSIWSDAKGTPEKREPLNLQDPLDVTIMNQFFRVGKYCNFQYLLYEVEAVMYYDPQTSVCKFTPLDICPWVGLIYQHFPVVGRTCLFEKLEQIVANSEGIR